MFHPSARGLFPSIGSWTRSVCVAIHRLTDSGAHSAPPCASPVLRTARSLSNSNSVTCCQEEREEKMSASLHSSSHLLIKQMIPSLFVLLALFTDQEMSKILGLNIPVFGAIVSSVGVVLIALTAGIVVCCCRKRAVQRRNNTNCAGTVAVSSINIIKSFQAFTLLYAALALSCFYSWFHFPQRKSIWFLK